MMNTIKRIPMINTPLSVTKLALLASAITLASCGGGGGAPGTSSENTNQEDNTGTNNTQDTTSGNNNTGSGDNVTDTKDEKNEQTLPEIAPPGISDYFAQTLQPLLEENCSQCHLDGPASPLFAHPDAEVGYKELINNQKINLQNSEQSRIVTRLARESHFCWSDCEQDSEAMLIALKGFYALAGLESIKKDASAFIPTLFSTNVTLADGQEQEAQRVEVGVIAKYEFLSAQGTVALDTSMVMPALDLTLDGVEWSENGGIKIVSGSARGSAESSKKLYDVIADPVNGSQEYTVEAWLLSDSADQEGPARIISYSQDTAARNFTLGQTLYNYNFRNSTQSAEMTVNGTPALQTADADMDLKPDLQHVVITYDQLMGRRIYVNGQFTGDIDAIAPEPLNWNPNYVFLLGNEATNNRLWNGDIRFVGIYDQAMADEAIQANFEAGIGTKTFIEFDVSDVSGIADTKIRFEVRDFDQHSYMFANPTAIVPEGETLDIRNMKIAINSVVPVAGQVYSRLDVTAEAGESSISNLATVIIKDQGPETDVFNLVFEKIGTQEQVIAPPKALVKTVSAEESEQSRFVGLRTFERVKHTMSVLTGVPANTANVEQVYQEVREQLPRNTDMATFVSANQIGISKLSLEFCDAMIEDPALRSGLFGDTNFDMPSMEAMAAEGDKLAYTTPMVERFIGNLENQPTSDDVNQVLMTLIDSLTEGCGDTRNCDAEYTRSIVKASCSALLSSAAVQLQ